MKKHQKSSQSSDDAIVTPAFLALSNEKKKFESVSIRHDPVYNDMVAVTPVVKKFIADRGLIVYGGTAIDYALRLHGASIYPDDALAVPDLDFFSPRACFDAYDLADMLYKAGYDECRAIRGIYVYVQKVDIRDNHWMADISYIPSDIFAKLPTIMYEGMRIIHPDFQRIDVHLSLSFPFTNPPGETIFARWKRDIERFNLVCKYYPINMPAKSTVAKVRMVPVRVPANDISHCMWGIAAYACISQCFQDFYNMIKKVYKKPIPDNIILSGITIDKKSKEFIYETFEVSIYGDTDTQDNTPIHDIFHHTPKHLIEEWEKENGKKCKKFHKYLGQFAESFEIPRINKETGENMRIHMFSLEDDLITVSGASFDDVKVRFTSVQPTLLYLLANAHRHEPPLKNMYLRYYTSLLLIVECVENMFKFLAEETKMPQDDIDSLANSSPFFTSINVYGKSNISLTYKILHKQDEINVGKRVKPYKVPLNYHPNSGNKQPEFDYTSSDWYKKSGDRYE